MTIQHAYETEVTLGGFNYLSAIQYFKKFRQQRFSTTLQSYLDFRFQKSIIFKNIRVYNDTILINLIFYGVTEQDFEEKHFNRVQNAVDLFYRDWFNIQRDGV